MKTYVRKATMADAENLLKWKNDPDMRKYSIVTQKKIAMKDHLKWLEKHLDEIFIIGESFGDVRVTNCEIAIKLAPEHRGKGYAKYAVQNMCMRYKGLIAKIVDGNVASLRLFISCGFKPISHEKKKGIGYYILQK